MKSDTAVVIVSFDGYADLWGGFFRCMEKFWPDVPYPVYLVNNEDAPELPGVVVVNTGAETCWGDRVKRALGRIREENIILLLEDYYFSEPVDSVRLGNIVGDFTEGKMDYLRLVPIPAQRKKSARGAWPLDEKAVYGVNLQASLWRRDYLLMLLEGDDLSAWEFEARQKTDSPERVQGNCQALNYYAFRYANMVIQGKWNPEAVETIRAAAGDAALPDPSARKTLTKRELSRQKNRSRLLHILPKPVINAAKPVLKKLGMNFVTK